MANLLRFKRIAHFLAMLVFCAPVWSTPVRGAVDGLAQAPDATAAREWGRLLDSAQKYVDGSDYTEDVSAGMLRRLTVLRAEAVEAKTAAVKQAEDTQRLIDALGPAPAKDAPPESAEIAAKRREYAKALAAHKARIAQAEVADTRAKTLQAAISSQRRVVLVDRLQRRQPLPIHPDVIVEATRDLARVAELLARSPLDWYGGLSEEQRERPDPYQTVFVLILIGVAAGGWVLRRRILARFGHDPADETPPYSRRLLAAIAEGVARGLVPAALVAGGYFWLISPGELLSGLFADLVGSLLGALFFLTLVAAMSRAVLAPDLPAWRLTGLSPDAAGLINRRLAVLASVLAADIAFQAATSRIDLGSELISLSRLIFTSLEAFGVVALGQAKLWRGGLEDEGSVGGAREERRGLLFWTLTRRVALVVALVGVAAAALGFTELGTYLLHSLLFSGVGIGGLWLLRGLMQELVNVLMDSALDQSHLNVRLKTLRRIDFWLRAALDPLLAVVGMLLVAPLWGVPRDDLMLWAGHVLTGFSVGSLTISLVDILLAGVTFMGLLVLVRMIQRRLQDSILPATRLDPSTQTSLTAGLGYIGFVIAAVSGISVAGIDLTNLALVAGALSVGIGFGLQNIVNNFISGLILLVERPIRVGDWVVVGESEGVVRRINIRATELETWERAAVVIPNADILSSKVMNWTLKDKLGRLDVKVGVAYGSDLGKVREILLACANLHPHVMADPPPSVYFQNFGDNSLDFELRCFTDDVTSRVRHASDLRFEIDRRFREEHIEIPFPQRTVHVFPPAAAASSF
ncbi:MAG: mechanosensitive ion channel family protein [Alphaproteobacteria bacterium]|nr:mechanosensitive ion channel family protein [Alphaproteobacteria bacterium]